MLMEYFQTELIWPPILIRGAVADGRFATTARKWAFAFSCHAISSSTDEFHGAWHKVAQYSAVDTLSVVVLWTLLKSKKATITIFLSMFIYKSIGQVVYGKVGDDKVRWVADRLACRQIFMSEE
ncbi:MAG: hypothetical protein ACR5LC_03790 [Symbiopectobacterium sp.]|uniref:hypothetical protein n=1 Tax=Symbiopectobacterium sp. TaxID=2952789 RepID=UPI003F381DC8